MNREYSMRKQVDPWITVSICSKYFHISFNLMWKLVRNVSCSFSLQIMTFQPRCNLCYTVINSPQAVFTSCGHFLCPKCYAEKMARTPDTCSQCGQSCSTLFIDVMICTCIHFRTICLKKCNNSLLAIQWNSFHSHWRSIGYVYCHSLI